MQHYNFRLIKSKASYSRSEISKLLGVDKRTCKRWVNEEGLKVIEPNQNPLLVMGADLIDFIKKKRAKRKMPLKEDEFICFKCHKVVRAKVGSGQIVKTGKRIGKNNREQYKKTGFCEICGTQVNKFLGVSQRD